MQPISEKNKSLFDTASELEPLFMSNSEALNYYSKKLQQLCSKYGKSSKEMMIFAEDSGIFNEDLLEFLSLDRKIGFFKDHEIN